MRQTPSATKMVTTMSIAHQRTGRMVLVLVLLLTAGGASAQTNVLIEACNGMKNAAKRADCLKAAKAQASPVVMPPTSKQPTSAVPTAPPAFSLDVAATVCESFMTKLAARHAEAAVDEAESDEQTMQVTWPGVDGKPPTYCGVDRQSRKIVSLGKGDKAMRGVQLDKFMTDRAKFAQLNKEMAEGNYKNFVAQAKQAVTRDFKDPSSVQYRGLFVSGTTLPVLCGEINGKNSYGAYIGFRRFYATSDGLLTMVENPKENYVFERMYPDMCGKKTVDIAE
ncbi:hypothetical protein GTP56_25155 [Duganella sp. FT134W]|uniref:DUF1311 domain-containing protein n=1 Tax=Duganella margarita TaxID=2692170 RepID=A0A7X4H4Z4_9BURK|nr:hypothetical protein [Duganella margarita]MYM75462.1 hypothetical protein [Duganella margarita]